MEGQGLGSGGGRKPSRSEFLKALAAGSVVVAAGARPGVAMAAAPEYVVRHDRPRQTILGLGVEIQSDSIGSGNDGLPEKNTSVPHDLTASERDRFFAQMLKGGRSDRGFRYCRLALGLYLRGLDAEKKQIVGRWPEQMAELKEMMDKSSMEGMAAEYWSPAPYWKSNGSYIGGTIKSTDPSFLGAFSDALVRDVEYIQSNGIPVTMWGLQNEPDVSDVAYSCCGYSDQQYYAAFKAVAPKIKARFPSMFVQNESRAGQYGRGSSLIRNDSATLSLVDGWSWHRIGRNSDEQLTNSVTVDGVQRSFTADRAGKPVFNNEFEYFSDQQSANSPGWLMVNTAQSIMNWMTFQNSPTWFWLHALKPTYNSEAQGFSLGFWRPYDDDDFSKFPNIEKGHWDYNKQNWHAVAGFVRYMPWNSVRYQVDEPAVSKDNRVMAWKTPQGKLVVALTNRNDSNNFTFSVNTGRSSTFEGHRFTLATANSFMGTKNGPGLSTTLPPYSVEFWIQRL